MFIDESGVLSNMTRLYGRTIGGNRIVDYVPGGHWKTTTIISSIRLNGSSEAMTVDGPLDSDVFKVYLSEVLCPNLKPGDIVIADNLSSHKVSGVEALVRGKGAEIWYLPPYSPDLNPIEKMWSKIKAILRKLKARTREELDQAISEAFNAVSIADAQGWFSSCGYQLIQS